MSVTSISAHALEEGFCAPPGELSGLVGAEGHRIFAQMERIGIDLERGGETRYGAVLVTAKPDLSRWYIIEGNEALDTPSTEMCVVSAGKQLEINDYRLKGQPSVTRYEFDHERALQECKELESGFLYGEEMGLGCNAYNVGLDILRRDTGAYIALQGLRDDGSLTTIIADPDDQGYRLLTTGRQGATLIARSGRNFTFSAWVLDILNQRQIPTD